MNFLKSTKPLLVSGPSSLLRLSARAAGRISEPNNFGLASDPPRFSTATVAMDKFGLANKYVGLEKNIW
jgi:hypothetical protein